MRLLYFPLNFWKDCHKIMVKMHTLSQRNEHGVFVTQLLSQS